ncbi:tetratricopeptide repeat-containing sensor histidine kinase [Pontimicrobium sp. MEBiC06410]
MNATLKQKIELYDSISDSLKKTYSSFFKKELKALNNSQITNSDKAKIAIILADIDRNQGKYIESVNTLRTLLEEGNVPLADSIDVLDNLNKTYYSLGLYSEIFEINTQINNLIDKGAYYPLWTYNVNSKLYQQLNQYEKAAKALKIEIKQLDKNERRDSLIIPSAYNNLGYYYFKAAKMDTALFYFNKSLKVASKSLSNDPVNRNRIIGLVHGNIAEIFIIKKEYKKAIPLLQEEVKYSLEYNQDKNNLVKAYCLLAEAYINTSAKEDVIRDVFKAVEKQLLISPHSKNKITFYKQKSAFYKKRKQMDSANFWLNETFKTHNEIEEFNKARVIKTNELILEINKKDKEIEAFKIEVKNNELLQKNKQQKRLFVFLFILSILLLISIYGVYRIKKDKKILLSKNTEIQNKNKEIEKALIEKEILLKEVHHRVKNNLQIISGLLELQNIKVDDQEIKIALEEGKNRIQSVALIHKMMYQSDAISKIKMQEYLEELVAMLKVSYENPQKPIDIIINVEKISIDIAKAVPISLIINEATCNVYKHAFTTETERRLEVVLKQTSSNNELILEIKDNGRGLPKNYSLENSKTIGFDLIKGLTRQLKGNLVVKNSNGLTIQIQFK